MSLSKVTVSTERVIKQRDTLSEQNMSLGRLTVSQQNMPLRKVTVLTEHVVKQIESQQNVSLSKMTTAEAESLSPSCDIRISCDLPTTLQESVAVVGLYISFLTIFEC